MESVGLGFHRIISKCCEVNPFTLYEWREGWTAYGKSLHTQENANTQENTHYNALRSQSTWNPTPSASQTAN